MKKLTKCKCKRCRRPRHKIIVVREKSRLQTSPRSNPTFHARRPCPVCGESSSSMHYICRGELDKGIIEGIQCTRNTGFLWLGLTTYDCFTCKTCGHQWEIKSND